MPAIEDTLIFVDGENLSIRYKAMIESGRKPRPSTVVIDNRFVWNPAIFENHAWNVKRVSYYTSIVGDDQAVWALRKKMSASHFSFG